MWLVKALVHCMKDLLFIVAVTELSLLSCSAFSSAVSHIVCLCVCGCVPLYVPLWCSICVLVMWNQLISITASSGVARLWSQVGTEFTGRKSPSWVQQWSPGGGLWTTPQKSDIYKHFTDSKCFSTQVCCRVRPPCAPPQKNFGSARIPWLNMARSRWPCAHPLRYWLPVMFVAGCRWQWKS